MSWAQEIGDKETDCHMKYVSVLMHVKPNKQWQNYDYGQNLFWQ